MATRPRLESTGYSLIEVLVVLAIVAILAIAGAGLVGNRQAAAVRSLLDELEGALTTAHATSVSTGRDVAILTWGTWDAKTPLRMAYGDAALTDAVIQADADLLLAGSPKTDVQGLTVAVPFKFLPNDVIQTRAQVVTVASTNWTNVMQKTSAGKVNDEITNVVPFSTGAMTGIIDDTNDLFTLDGNTHRVVISGSSKRFTSNFIIPIVGTSPSGGALPGGPMGLIVVLANGGSIYKFFNPGIRESDGKWRRI